LDSKGSSLVEEIQSDRLAISARLRIAREHAGLSQGQAASKLNLHRPAISEIEAGRRKVSAEELMALAELYDVSVSWLTKGASEMSNPLVELAARELAKLKHDDLDAILKLIQTFRQAEDAK
jgi:transcriptional regulator with XRE-family HTH domain